MTEAIMTEVDRRRADRRRAMTPAPKARKDPGSLTKLSIVAILGVGIGIHVGKTLSNEPTSPQAVTAAGLVTGAATRSQAPSNDPGYFPNQFVNQAKEIEPLPPQF